MTREEIKHITDLCFNVPVATRRFGEERTYYAEEIAAAKKYVMDLLEQELCEDCVSRADAKGIIAQTDITDGYESVFSGRQVIGLLDFLPSVQPKVKTGHWVNGDDICPCCGKSKFEDLDADIYADWRPKYCPNCGAKMESEAKE